MKPPKLSSPPAIASLLALFLGIGLGLLVFRSQSPFWRQVAESVSAFGTLWTNALRMMIIPLIVSTLIVAVAGDGSSRGIGRITGLAYATFLGLLATGVIFVMLILPPVLSRLHLGARQISATPSLESAGAGGAPVQPEKSSSLIDVIATLLPSNLVAAASNDDLLPIVIFSILVGLATSRIDASQRLLFISVLRSLSTSVQIIIGWILWIMPAGIFAFAFATSANLGWGAVGILGHWIAIVSTLAISLTVGLYFIAVVIGGVNLKSFAKAVLPAQAVAFATRSSLAALPALLSGARKHLQSHETVAGVVLPLSVSSFKINRSILSTSRLLFLAYVYGVSLTPAGVAAFLVSAMLMSFSSPGLPARGPVASLPLYLAVGIPLEGIVLLRSVDAISDLAMTLLNVTGDMTAMTVVARLSGTSRYMDAPTDIAARQVPSEGYNLEADGQIKNRK